ncbi:porin [Aeromonas fluvialis]|uniref:porin n=1 Tax=Aeromonas fluvialis TaxID=591962 RepID=UPI0005A8114F|nr:porin [Aeromonas fluvialis]
MKKSALTLAISSLFVAGGAIAVEGGPLNENTIFQEGESKLEIGGRAQGMYYGTDDDGTDDDQSYFRVNMRGETKIAPEMTAFGFAEYNLPTAGSDNDEVRHAHVGIKHDRFGTFTYGRQDGLFTMLNDYTDVLPEWGGDGLGKGVEVFGTGRTNGLAKYVFNYNSLTLGAQFTGNNDPQNSGRSDKSVDLGNGETDKWNAKGSDQGFAVLAAYDFDMGLSLMTSYNQASKTSEQGKYASFGGDDDAKLYGVGAKYTNGNLYLAATYAHGEDHLFIGKYNGYAEKHDGYEAVAQYTIGKFKPSLAYLRTDVKDDDNRIDDTYTEYVSIGAWYNFTKNFNAYVDYQLNLLDDDTNSTSKLGRNTDDTLAVALQYNF